MSQQINPKNFASPSRLPSTVQGQVSDDALRSYVDGPSRRRLSLSPGDVRSMARELLRRRSADTVDAIDFVRTRQMRTATDAFFRNFAISGNPDEYWSVDLIAKTIADDLAARYCSGFSVATIHDALTALDKDATRCTWIEFIDGRPLMTGLRAKSWPL